MATFYLTFRVSPLPSNPEAGTLGGCVAFCWVIADSAPQALNKASFYVQRFYWKILTMDRAPTEVTEQDFEGRDLGQEQYLHAQERGIAIVFSGWAADGRTSRGPTPIEQPEKFNLNSYLARKQKLSDKGICLHYDAGARCNEIIDAHSIQREGALSLVSEKGHVYSLSHKFGDIKRRKGRVCYSRQGIGNVSTFRGFCKKHDNEVFRPIDTMPLIPTQEQMLLYAYRSVCRETFVKENSVRLLDDHASTARNQAVENLLRAAHEGGKHGLRSLLYHKDLLEDALVRHRCEIRYALFCSRQSPTLVFSGLVYPDFDFLGRHLQDLSDTSKTPDLLTFSFARMEQGWGVLFAWHVASSGSCVPFMQSLATVMHGNESRLEDSIFRFVVSNCENLAIAPGWWEGLSSSAKYEVESVASHGTDLFVPPDPEYLTRGLEGLSGWEFTSVQSEMH